MGVVNIHGRVINTKYTSSGKKKFNGKTKMF